jgi:hypothetical protein
MNSSMNDLVSCPICQHIINPDDQNECRCGDIICDACPAYACSCIESDPAQQALQVRLRRVAIEAAQLTAKQELMRELSISEGQELLLLTSLRDSLNEEFLMRADELSGEFDYSQDW